MRFLAKLLLLLWISSAVYVAAEEMSGRDLALQVRNRDNGVNLLARGKMTLVDASQHIRTREYILYTRDNGDAVDMLLRFESPEDIAGTAFLSLEKEEGETEQFLYLPALKRTRRVVSSQKQRRFVNTDFSFEDMERRPVDQWEHRITGREKVGEADCIVLESRPKKGTNTAYSLVRSWIVQGIHVPIRVDYLDAKGQTLKEYRVGRLENIQGFWTEMTVSMADLTSGHRTIMDIEKAVYNTDMSDELFTSRNLEKW